MASVPTGQYLKMSNAAPEKQLWRLEQKTVVDEATGCWNWTGSKTLAGYGQMRVMRKRMYVHRISWTLRVGPIPDGLTIDHLCRNRACVNPNHLEPVLHAVNCSRAGTRQTHCRRGHPFSGDNLRINSKGRRICRACVRRRDAERWQRELSKRKGQAA